jgi:CBS domain-containing protein
VDEDGMLVGIITSSDIRLAMPSDEEALRKFEVSALINAVEVDTIMTRDVITTTPDATLNQAAKLMLQHKVGALPVVENERLVGIITDSDIFRALVNDDSMWT